MTTTTVVEQLPDELVAELSTMRRDPANFSVARRAGCTFCEERTYLLSHPKCAEAGSWCPVHGWLYFESPQLEPEW